MTSNHSLKDHKKTAWQKTAKALGVRPSRSKPLKKAPYTDEDVDLFANEVELLAELLDMRRSGATIKEMDRFAEANKEGIKLEQSKIKRLVNDWRDANNPKLEKKSWNAPVSPALLDLFRSRRELAIDFTTPVGELKTPLKSASAKQRANQKAKTKPVIQKPRQAAKNSAIPMATNRSRARVQPTYKSNKQLDALRTQIWFEYLLSSAIPYEIDGFLQANWLNALITFVAQKGNSHPDNSRTAEPKPIPDLNLAFENWLVTQLSGNSSLPGLPHNLCERRYQSGQETPGLSTLQTLDAFVPGSLNVYQNGLFNLPIWSILSGDMNACRSFINSTVQQQGLFQSSEQQYESLIKELMPYYAIPESDALKQYIESICSGSVSDSELASIAHPALEARIDAIYATVDERVLSIGGRAPYTKVQIAALPEMLLAALALLKICSDQKSGPVLQLEWLVMGLCCGLYSDLFTESIQDYILHDLRVNGDLLTEHFADIGIPIISFGQRWEAYRLI